MERLGEQLRAATVTIDAVALHGADGPFRGTATSKREAEKIAARAAIAFLHSQPRPRHNLSWNVTGAVPGSARASPTPAQPEPGTFEYREKAAAFKAAQMAD